MTIWGVTILSFIVFCIREIDYLFRRTSQRYAREWKEQHPSQ